MRNFQEKRQWRDILSSRFIIIPLFLLLIIGGVSSFRALMQGWEAQSARKETEVRIQELEEERRQLSSELEEFKSGRAIEREARQKLNLRKPGEEVIIIVDGEDKEDSPVLEKKGIGARVADFFRQWRE
ncbi:MAG: hypothetical protein COU90_01675 [Candidatus Ryanbacteria bacterium CG10_big_fil_rev_8_21_14_0_10_43_42]|uniref:Septum formation initiator n=1 Tax=Candidatus Ryanbacteria bacterium CG10_big_fil_rev_8_21_14_0_10_43_42 TaxID=1974864 RepID=A0A2M8KXC8_9BACT|nr:MAG: hypothetical protein COU90_01675 [Candidatus Ryanbacteria bacterium CG10_big_fil_rev_8_21_14_0_10_43_42]